MDDDKLQSYDQYFSNQFYHLEVTPGARWLGSCVYYDLRSIIANRDVEIAVLKQSLQAFSQDISMKDTAQEPDVCECGDPLGWCWEAKISSGALNGALNLADISFVFYLGCERCSSTIRTLDTGTVCKGLPTSTGK